MNQLELLVIRRHQFFNRNVSLSFAPMMVWKGGNWISLIALHHKNGVIVISWKRLGALEETELRLNVVCSRDSSWLRLLLWLIWLPLWLLLRWWRTMRLSHRTHAAFPQQTDGEPSMKFPLYCQDPDIKSGSFLFFYKTKRGKKWNRWHTMLRRITVYQVAPHHYEYNSCSMNATASAKLIPLPGIYSA